MDISSHLCACLHWKTISTADSLVVRFGADALSFFNRLLSVAGNQCATLELVRLVNARKLTDQQTYQIQFETRPGDGLFEFTADVRPENQTFDLQRQQISRLNPYGNASACIAEIFPELRDLCFCSK